MIKRTVARYLCLSIKLQALLSQWASVFHQGLEAWSPNKEEEMPVEKYRNLSIDLSFWPTDFFIGKSDAGCCNRQISKFQWLRTMEIIHIIYQTNVPGPCVVLQMVILVPSVIPSYWSVIFNTGHKKVKEMLRIMWMGLNEPDLEVTRVMSLPVQLVRTQVTWFLTPRDDWDWIELMCKGERGNGIVCIEDVIICIPKYIQH